LGSAARVVRIDTQDVVGAGLADDHAVRKVPSILVFNGSGKMVYHNTGIPDAEYIRELIHRLPTPKPKE
jgi:hypothetical protein